MVTFAVRTVKRGPAFFAVVLLLGACGDGATPHKHTPQPRNRARQRSPRHAGGGPRPSRRKARACWTVPSRPTSRDAPPRSGSKETWSGQEFVASPTWKPAPRSRRTPPSTSPRCQSNSPQPRSCCWQMTESCRSTTRSPSHVPGLPEWAETVTLAQLMHQTSGIPDYIGLLEDEGYAYSDRTTQEQALQVLAKVPELQFEPGAQLRLLELQLPAARRYRATGLGAIVARLPVRTGLQAA